MFFAGVLALLVAYTEMAFELEWRSVAGRIGPGFFPRFVGGIGVAVTLLALVKSLRASGDEDEGDDALAEDEVGEGDLGRHPWALALMVLAGAVFVAVLTSLGSILASALFMFAVLWFLNRTHVGFNVVLSVGLPVGLYLLLQSFLNAGIPAGILPSF